MPQFVDIQRNLSSFIQSKKSFIFNRVLHKESPLTVLSVDRLRQEGTPLKFFPVAG